jgi:hypothetical protein
MLVLLIFILLVHLLSQLEQLIHTHYLLHVYPLYHVISQVHLLNILVSACIFLAWIPSSLKVLKVNTGSLFLQVRSCFVHIVGFLRVNVEFKFIIHPAALVCSDLLGSDLACKVF